MRKQLVEQSGQSIVEFALVFPVVMILMLGLLQLILIGVSRIVLENAAFDGARTAALTVDKEPSTAEKVAESIIEEKTKTIAGKPGLLKDRARVESLSKTGDELSLSVEGHIKWLPLLEQALGLTGPGWSLKATAVAKVEPYVGD